MNKKKKKKKKTSDDLDSCCLVPHILGTGGRARDTASKTSIEERVASFFTASLILFLTTLPPLHFNFQRAVLAGCRSNMHTTINERCTYHQQHQHADTATQEVRAVPPGHPRKHVMCRKPEKLGKIYGESENTKTNLNPYESYSVDLVPSYCQVDSRSKCLVKLFKKNPPTHCA